MEDVDMPQAGATTAQLTPQQAMAAAAAAIALAAVARQDAMRGEEEVQPARTTASPVAPDVPVVARRVTTSPQPRPRVTASPMAADTESPFAAAGAAAAEQVAQQLHTRFDDGEDDHPEQQQEREQAPHGRGAGGGVGADDADSNAGGRGDRPRQAPAAPKPRMVSKGVGTVPQLAMPPKTAFNAQVGSVIYNLSHAKYGKKLNGTQALASTTGPLAKKLPRKANGARCPARAPSPTPTRGRTTSNPRIPS